ncbi:nucleoside deaminase [Oerskovia enterophila]|uniref:Guanine deaminase n=1 Tax=Oerskovia enterophila TaxID=43678 RepID=A0A165S1H2_9CELL|nr:nucleoside deaminase [Oerskovia enterophila]KZM35420.1 guanine deaminase [Oerskovia enterophila]
MDTSDTHAAHLERAVAVAVANVAADGGPFGALLVTSDGQVFEGANRVTSTNDPTAHAEVVAIRAACAALGTFDLRGSVLYASCEPCPMCLAAGLWARVDAIWFAADRGDAARAGFDDATFYEFFAEAPEDRSPPVRRQRTASSGEPFDAWRELDSHTGY